MQQQFSLPQSPPRGDSPLDRGGLEKCVDNLKQLDKLELEDAVVLRI